MTSSMSTDPIRIILLLMIKNESRIIERAIRSALPIVDAVCVSDTGSTDNTLEVLEALYPTLTVPCKTPSSDPAGTQRVPCKTYDHPWTNFGVNRTKSFNDAKQFCHELDWNPARTYVLAVDADMELIIKTSFNKQADLGLKGYSLTQKAGTLHYINARLLRIDCPWSCKGATHEYWDGPMEATLSDSKLWINDKNDGGCKADKYTRDRALLEKELIEQPTNVRTHFYLAQTYKCLGLYELSADMYKKRIALGGWFEEVWYSYFMVAEQMLLLDKPEEAEMWVLKGQAYNNYRAEALYILVKHFRIKGQQWKAMHYYREAKQIPKPAVALFLQSDVYDHLLDYEYTVLQFYVNPLRKEGRRASMAYMLRDQCRPLLENVFSNMEFYVEPLLTGSDLQTLHLPAIEPYRASSCSATLHEGTLVLNARYVNYSVSDKGDYSARDPENIVRTQNVFVPSIPSILTEGVTAQFIADDPTLPSNPVNIMGLEDVRLYSEGSDLLYTATSKSCTSTGLYRMVLGTYDPSANQFCHTRILEPPYASECEKNWLIVPKSSSSNNSPLFVYKWHPFEAGSVNDANQLQITLRHDTPPYFQKLRGSANGILVQDRIWCLTHVVKYGSPRKYYHHIVVLNKVTLKPELISTPFYFQTHGIEYCLGFHLNGAKDGLILYVSTFDANPKAAMMPLTAFEFLPV